MVFPPRLDADGVIAGEVIEARNGDVLENRLLPGVQRTVGEQFKLGHAPDLQGKARIVKSFGSGDVGGCRFQQRQGPVIRFPLLRRCRSFRFRDCLHRRGGRPDHPHRRCCGVCRKNCRIGACHRPDDCRRRIFLSVVRSLQRPISVPFRPLDPDGTGRRGSVRGAACGRHHPPFFFSFIHNRTRSIRSSRHRLPERIGRFGSGLCGRVARPGKGSPLAFGQPQDFRREEQGDDPSHQSGEEGNGHALQPGGDSGSGGRCDDGGSYRRFCGGHSSEARLLEKGGGHMLRRTFFELCLLDCRADAERVAELRLQGGVVGQSREQEMFLDIIGLPVDKKVDKLRRCPALLLAYHWCIPHAVPPFLPNRFGQRAGCGIRGSYSR